MTTRIGTFLPDIGILRYAARPCYICRNTTTLKAMDDEIAGGKTSPRSGARGRERMADVAGRRSINHRDR